MAELFVRDPLSRRSLSRERVIFRASASGPTPLAQMKRRSVAQKKYPTKKRVVFEHFDLIGSLRHN